MKQILTLAAKKEEINVPFVYGSPVISGTYGHLTPETHLYSAITEKDTHEDDLHDLDDLEPKPITRKSAGRKYRYSDKYQKKILLDEFDEPYFAHEKDDISIPVPLSLPQSLNEALDKKLERIRNHPDINKRKEKIKKSRYIRQLIERDLKVIYREA